MTAFWLGYVIVLTLLVVAFGYMLALLQPYIQKRLTQRVQTPSLPPSNVRTFTSVQKAGQP